MRLRWKMRRTWRVALAALLTLVLAVAPLTAQFVMASHAYAAPRDHGGHVHGISAGTHHASHVGIDHYHHVDQAPGHHHESALVDIDSTVVPVGQHDHGDGQGAGCCGTFCHSAFFLTACSAMPINVVRPDLDDRTWRQTIVPGHAAEKRERPGMRSDPVGEALRAGRLGECVALVLIDWKRECHLAGDNRRPRLRDVDGTVDNVVFPIGIDRRDDLGMPDRFDVYYGMADYRIGVARL